MVRLFPEIGFISWQPTFLTVSNDHFPAVSRSKYGQLQSELRTFQLLPHNNEQVVPRSFRAIHDGSMFKLTVSCCHFETHPCTLESVLLLDTEAADSRQNVMSLEYIGQCTCARLLEH